MDPLEGHVDISRDTIIRSFVIVNERPTKNWSRDARFGTTVGEPVEVEIV